MAGPLILCAGCSVELRNRIVNALAGVPCRIAVADGAGNFEALRRLRASGDRVPVLFAAGESSEDLAISAFRAGVSDYFRLPSEADALIAAVRGYASSPALEEDGDRLIARAPAVLEIKALLPRIAASGSTVLITGETGTGKELVAELVHRYSRRSAGPMVAVNCAAIPEALLESEMFGHERGSFTGADTSADGKLQLADKGTIFFDEIGDMSLAAQAKILRVLESRQVQRIGGKASVPIDVRVVAATNQNLEELTRTGGFRKDLYFRLNVVRLHLPALRDRRQDIAALVHHYVAEFNNRFGQEIEGMSDEAMESLLRYDWPGNVRELRNLIESSFVVAKSRKLEFCDLPAQFRETLRTLDGHSPNERERVLAALLATNWNKSRSAQKLHWSRMTLYRKIAKYQLE